MLLCKLEELVGYFTNRVQHHRMLARLRLEELVPALLVVENGHPGHELVKEALAPMMPRITKEMPSVVEKLQMLEVETVDKLVGNFKTFFES